MRVLLIVNTIIDLLTVTGVLAGIGGLLFLMSALDPTSVRRNPTHRATRERTGLARSATIADEPARPV